MSLADLNRVSRVMSRGAAALDVPGQRAYVDEAVERRPFAQPLNRCLMDATVRSMLATTPRETPTDSLRP